MGSPSAGRRRAAEPEFRSLAGVDSIVNRAQFHLARPGKVVVSLCGARWGRRILGIELCCRVRYAGLEATVISFW